MDDQEDTKEMKHSLWYKTSESKLWTSLLKKRRKSRPMPTTSCNRYLICCYNLNAVPVEPNYEMHIHLACYICKFEITLEEGIANQVTIAYFHFALCYECLDWMICKLVLLPPASCIGCIMHHKHMCIYHVGIPPSWVQREHSSRKSS